MPTAHALHLDHQREREVGHGLRVTAGGGWRLAAVSAAAMAVVQRRSVHLWPRFWSYGDRDGAYLASSATLLSPQGFWALSTGSGVGPPTVQLLP